MNSIKNQIIVITGCSRGIGLEFCRQLSIENTVWAFCRKASPELKSMQVEIIEGVDLGEENSFEKIYGLKPPGPVDLLINNAGILEKESFDLDYKEGDFRSLERQFQVNTLGPLRTTMGLLSRLKKGAKVAMITSLMGSIGDNHSGGYWGYRASKCALNMLSKNLAIELKPLEISVGLFHPGYVITDMTNHQGHLTSEESVKGLIQQIACLNLSNSGHFVHTNGKQLPW